MSRSADSVIDIDSAERVYEDVWVSVEVDFVSMWV